MTLTEGKIITALKQHSYKITPQRCMIIKEIVSHQGHLTPSDIYKKIHQENPDIGLVTVYRTLEILAELELICELHSGSAGHSYTISDTRHHHHLICSGCGKVVDFTTRNLTGIQQNLCRDTGFRIDSHFLEFTGLCRVCQV
ncbi:Fur family transcriptional regulator [Chloroflexota bacterium]